MRQTVVRGVSSWSRWQPDRGLDFNGFFCEHADGNLVVDPVEPDEETLAELRARGVAAILVTNRDHERFSAAVAEATGAPVIASERDGPLLARAPDRTVRPGERLCGWTVLDFDGLKTAGEIALADFERRAVLVGDALWGQPSGALRIMPKVEDASRATLSLRALRAFRPAHVLVGDGACIFGYGYEALNEALDDHDGVLAGRVNVDELRFHAFPGSPPPFGGRFAEVGFRLGATKLESAATRLARGEHFCPNHWHTAQEELFVVLEGTPSIRTPCGTFELRRGDIVAFPTTPAGAHRLFNDAEQDAVVLLIANADRSDMCFYPDSNKVMLGDPGPVVSAGPELDYFEGETLAYQKEA